MSNPVLCFRRAEFHFSPPFSFLSRFTAILFLPFTVASLPGYVTIFFKPL